MRALVTILATLAFTPTAHAQTVTSDSGAGYITPSSIPLETHVVGRVMTGAFSKGAGASEVDGQAYVHKWPGVYWKAAFTGTTLDLRFEDTANRYELFVDDKSVAKIERPGTVEYRIAGLDKGYHRVRLAKITESQDATGQFDGFFVPDGGDSVPLVMPKRQIEFIGDSFSAGYGNTSSKRDCTQDEVWATTDTQQAWGPLTARQNGADYQVNAYSGMGMVRDYNGVAPGRTMPAVYGFDLMDDKVGDYDPGEDNWNPQVVVIALGGNDFSTPLNPGEKWTSEDALTADYIATYVTFVQGLRATHPDAHFVFVTYGEDRVRSALGVILDRLKQAGETRADVLDVGGNFARTGCDWHLNLDDDNKVAARVQTFLDQHPDYWGS